MSRSSESTSSGIGFGGALILLFVGLKLTGYINWSWWWVVSPVWIALAIAILLAIISVALRHISLRKSKLKRK